MSRLVCARAAATLVWVCEDIAVVAAHIHFTMGGGMGFLEEEPAPPTAEAAGRLSLELRSSAGFPLVGVNRLINGLLYGYSDNLISECQANGLTDACSFFNTPNGWQMMVASEFR